MKMLDIYKWVSGAECQSMRGQTGVGKHILTTTQTQYPLSLYANVSM